MKPVNIGGHSAYQNRVLTQLRKYYPDAANALSSSTWKILDKFWSLDLSEIDVLMQDRYSSFGHQPRFPSDMLRAILVSVEFKITSYTGFASDLKENYLYVIVSGYSVGDTPGVGTFYDINVSDSLIKTTAQTQYARLSNWDIFNQFFLQQFVTKGLISQEKLSVAGDETPVYTVAQQRKTRTCNCLENGIRDYKCNRIYHQPDCDIGWDSHHNRYYCGYHLYMLTASDSANDLPVFPFLSLASGHDSHGFLYNWFSMKLFLPQASVNKLIFDTAVLLHLL